MAFKIVIEVGDDGASKWSMSTQDAGVTVGMAAAATWQVLGWVLQNAATRVPTEEEAEAMEIVRARKRALPDGWEDTLDGAPVTMSVETGTRALHKNFRRISDGALCDAPCDAEGKSVEATRDVIAAFEKSNPSPVTAEA